MVHQVAERYGRSPREVREEWTWPDVCDALLIGRAVNDATEVVQKYRADRRGGS